MKNIWLEIILNLDRWFKRCYLKNILFIAVAAILFIRAYNLCSFSGGHLYEELLFKCTMVQEKEFKEKI